MEANQLYIDTKNETIVIISPVCEFFTKASLTSQIATFIVASHENSFLHFYVI